MVERVQTSEPTRPDSTRLDWDALVRLAAGMGRGLDLFIRRVRVRITPAAARCFSRAAGYALHVVVARWVDSYGMRRTCFELPAGTGGGAGSVVVELAGDVVLIRQENEDENIKESGEEGP